ncbi:cytochrome P450 [Sporichthya brevicatena]|uniref:Cytochrome P450 n=1 Tax=Sporichthya brevicatena TaxID=171442 RepID=A0ABN1GIX4_9ACTN
MSSGTEAGGFIEPSEFHLYDQTVNDDFWRQVNHLRETCPAGWSNGPWSEFDSGFWFFNDFATVQKVATNWREFSSAEGAAPMQFDLDIMRMIPLETDPPMHRDIRKALNPFFTPTALKEQEPRLHAIVDRLMERCLTKAEGGQVDFVAEFTRRLPPLIFFEAFLGQREEEIGWILEALETLLLHPERALEVAPKLMFWEAEIIESRRAEGKRDDLIGVIAHLEVEGVELDERQRVETFNLMILAGMETTMGGLASVAWELACVPDVRRMLARADEKLLDSATDEFLRHASPVPGAARTAHADVEVAGCPVKSGDRVLLNWASANRDPKQFPEPDELIFDRSNAASHVAFGAGIHRCLGNHLARREVKAMIRAVCSLSSFEVEPGFAPQFRPSMARGPLSLPVTMAR